MYRNDLNERSPMRVFEKSMTGGLGRGSVGVVAARAGVGKTPLLVQIALDDLMRGHRVLHISLAHAVDHVRAYYDEIFYDLSEVSRLEDPDAVKLDIERHRLILSLMASREAAAASRRTPLSKIVEAVNFARDVAHFEPEVLVLDGFDPAQASDDALRDLAALARDRNVELWVSATVEAGSGSGLPEALARIAPLAQVIVWLEPDREVVSLRLLKDHDTKDLAELRLRLDPHTMRIVDEDVPPASERPRNPRRYRLLSGGGKGAEAAFGACAERWGIAEVNYSFEGHRYLERDRGVVVLSEDELLKGDFSLVYVSKRLNRVLSEIPLVRKILQAIWHQLNGAHQVFVVGTIQADNTVRGGTGWGAELARLWKKPLFVFDQDKRAWFRWTGTGWEIVPMPIISNESFAGIGTQELSDVGRAAIEDLFLRSFGEPEHA